MDITDFKKRSRHTQVLGFGKFYDMQNIYLYSKKIAAFSSVVGVEADDPIPALAKNRGFCFFFIYLEMLKCLQFVGLLAQHRNST